MSWHVGNAADDGLESRGWFVGHFLDGSAGVRASHDVEIKWAFHARGERRDATVSDESRTTVLILVHGTYRIELSVGDFVLARPGDYAMWGAGIDHVWEAVEDSQIITVRWPSIAR